MVRVGIPRALLYYQYYPMWRAFFRHLGAEVVTSPPTTRTVLASGSSRVVAETCLPAKVFIGHVLSLVNECDYMFIPAVRSVEKKAYNCSKFLGLPDMTKAVVPECPPILDPDIDVNKGRRELYQNIYKVGRHFTWNPLRIKEAAREALRVHEAYQEQMHAQGENPSQAIRQMFASDEKREGNGHEIPPDTIALIGHPYILYDDYINHRLISRLEGMGTRVLVPEMASKDELDVGVGKVVGRTYWTYEEEVVGAGGHYLENGTDGVIGVLAFGCGPDSLMMDAVRRHAKKLKRPFMSLTLDEHTAEAGLVTRLEAFLDMIRRRQRRCE
jgi:predicted nucleotide-binding protein (sugar kinase/HSP70/actin superfamily)